MRIIKKEQDEIEISKKWEWEYLKRTGWEWNE